MAPVAAFEHLLESYDLGDLLDDIASADPPAYLRRCFAEGYAAPYLSWPRVQQLVACAMVVDAVANARDYPGFEPELIADWRMHYAASFGQFKEPAVQALRRARERDSVLADGAAPGNPHKPEITAELVELERRLSGA
jgi:hypothetical protein